MDRRTPVRRASHPGAAESAPLVAGAPTGFTHAPMDGAVFGSPGTLWTAEWGGLVCRMPSVFELLVISLKRKHAASAYPPSRGAGSGVPQTPDLGWPSGS